MSLYHSSLLRGTQDRRHTWFCSSLVPALYSVICVGVLSVRREDNECLRRSLAPTPPKLAEQSLCPPPPVYYLFKGSGTGGKLVDWNLFTASSCQQMEGLQTAFTVLLLMIQVLNFAPSRLLFPVLFNGSGASLSHAFPSHHFRSFHPCLSVFHSSPWTRL